MSLYENTVSLIVCYYDKNQKVNEKQEATCRFCFTSIKEWTGV